MDTAATSWRRLSVPACALAGLLGGLLCMVLGQATWITGPSCGVAYGVVFALLARDRARSAGSGLIWALAFAFLLWLAGPAGVFSGAGGGAICDLESGREHFAELVAYLVCFGIPLGLTLGTIGARARPRQPDTRHSLARAIVVGGIAGIVGGWVFAHAGAQQAFNPLAQGSLPGESHAAAALLHVCASAAIGATFGLLFQRDVRGLGSCAGWGLAYGMLWWFVGPLTLSPLLKGQTVDWSASAAAPQYGLLVGHVFFGLLMGFVYAAVDRMWIGFFYESDPLHREREGSGTRAALAIAWGAIAGIAGGLLFSLPMLDTGILPYVAQIVGGTSAALGFCVHIVISAVVGVIYGLLFAREASSASAAIGWGLVYGLVWWFLGQLTLFPRFIGVPYDWSITDASAALPSLIGHLIYGATAAFVFWILERRHGSEIATDPRFDARAERIRAKNDSPAPALCVLALGLGVILPIILG